MPVLSPGSMAVQPSSTVPVGLPPSELSSRDVQPRSYCQSVRPSPSLSIPSLHSHVPGSQLGSTIEPDPAEPELPPTPGDVPPLLPDPIPASPPEGLPALPPEATVLPPLATVLPPTLPAPL